MVINEPGQHEQPKWADPWGSLRPADAGTPPSAPEPSQAATEAHDRRERYAEAIWPGAWEVSDLDLREIANVMAVADAEQAELRAEVERLRRERDDLAEAFKVEVGYSRKQIARSEAAEAKVARIEALADAFHQEGLDLGAASYQIGTDAQDASDDLARESETWRAAAERVRAALDGDA